MLRRSLERLPPTLDETYERILCAIHEEHSIYALRILRWLAFSLRPLSLEEVAETVAVDPGSHLVLNKNEVLEDALDALNICASLLTVSSSDYVEVGDGGYCYKREETEEKRVVHLAHYSVKEYLTSERIRNGPAKTYSLQEDTFNIIIANSCVGYLLQFQDAESFRRETIEKHKLARYSAKFWIDHARSYISKEESTQKLVMKLFSKGDGAFLNWIRIYDMELWGTRLGMRKQAADVALPLYYASLVGLTESVRCLLHHWGADINAQGGKYGSALTAASSQGYKTVVKLLLAAGADVNAQGGNALEAASSQGYKTVVKLLLAAGADININAQGGIYDNAPQAASDRGYEALVKLLLAAGADINTQGGSALKAALSQGYKR